MGRLKKATVSLMPSNVERRLSEFEVESIDVECESSSMVRLICILLHSKLKNIITHLLVVQFSSFQRHNLIFYQLASVGTQEKAAHTTTGGEGSWDRSEIEDADFFCC